MLSFQNSRLSIHLAYLNFETSLKKSHLKDAVDNDFEKGFKTTCIKVKCWINLLRFHVGLLEWQNSADIIFFARWLRRDDRDSSS